MTVPSPKFGPFAGVFTPTVITILGVIMYLREGWVVGHAGLGGAWLIIAASITIAACTGLSLSSIATNTQIKAGGAYAIIARSLGLEIGTTVGLALYFAQTLAITMYIFGFREGWLSIFPAHDPLMIDIFLFISIGIIAIKSAKLSFQLQYVVMGVTVLSIVIAAFGPWRSSPAEIVWWGLSSNHSPHGFWTLFAVFFPAVTGVMAGAAMSGELKDPSRAIPQGTLSAIAVSGVIYFALAYILSRMGSPEQLIQNTDILTQRCAWPWFMQFAILCATASSALATLVGAPRIIQAVAMDESIPMSKWLKERANDGEPRNATFLTAGIALLALSLRDLNSIAPLITICFLCTYAMINGVVVIEQGLGLVNFRPRIRIPILVPAIGFTGSVVAMLVIKPALSLSTLGLMILLYDWMSRQERREDQADVRGNLFVALAQWAAIRADSLPRSEARAWRPYPMVPIIDSSLESTKLATDLLSAGDRLNLVELIPRTSTSIDLTEINQTIEAAGLNHSHTVIHYTHRDLALGTTIQALRGSFFRPNILCLSLETLWSADELNHIVQTARQAQMGLVLQAKGQDLTESSSFLNVWIRPQSPKWDMTSTVGSMDLAILIALRLSNQLNYQIRLISTIPNMEEYEKGRHFLAQVIEKGRLDRRTEIQLVVGHFQTARKTVPPAAAQIFGLSESAIQQSAQAICKTSKGRILFVQGSGQESVLD
ncbi:MAG: amino acid permease [Myxococcota bacterium]